MTRVLISGLGSIGRRHLSNLKELGISDFVLHRSRPEPLQSNPHLPVYTDLSDAFATDPDLALITSPTAFHVSGATAAVRYGCHFFVEKPVSHTLDGVQSLLDGAEEAGLITFVGFDLRFDPGLQRVHGLLSENAIGRVTSLHAEVGQYLPDWHPGEDYRTGVSARKETGGGVLLDLIHELDYVSWLLGPVSDVSCFADRVSSLQIETEDTAAVLLRFDSGAIATVNLDYVRRRPQRSCTIVGEEGTIEWNYYDQTVSVLSPESSKDTWSYAGFERNDRFRAEMTHLLRCLDGSAEPTTDLRRGVEVLRIALAAKESADRGEVIRLQK